MKPNLASANHPSAKSVKKFYMLHIYALLTFYVLKVKAVVSTCEPRKKDLLYLLLKRYVSLLWNRGPLASKHDRLL